MKPKQKSIPSARTTYLSETFHKLRSLAKDKDLTIGTVVESLGAQSHGFLILLLCLPFMLPIPVPGLSILFGLLIAAISISWAFEKSPWLPQAIKKRRIQHETLLKMLQKGESLTRRLEFIVHPRMTYLFSFRLLRLIVALVLMFCGLFLALPLPPGTNFPPAFVMLFLSLAIIERDSLLLLFGLIVFVIEIVIFYGAIQLAFRQLSNYFF